MFWAARNSVLPPALVRPVVEPESAITPPIVSMLPFTVSVRVVVVAVEAVPRVTGPVPRLRYWLPVNVKSAFRATGLFGARIRLLKELSRMAPAPANVSVPVPRAVGLPSCSVPWLTVTPPEKVLLPERLRIEVPFLMMPPVPLTWPTTVVWLGPVTVTGLTPLNTLPLTVNVAPE